MRKRKKGYGVMCPRCGKTHFTKIIAYVTTCRCGYLFNSQDALIAAETEKLSKKL